MAEIKYYGICTTCNFAASCANSKSAKNPIYFCEMFDDSMPPEKKIVAKPGQKPSPTSDIVDKFSSKYKGLCINCENRKTCKFARTDEGIWHCAEYQ